MSRSIEDLQKQIDLYLNTISCDQQALTVILQVLLRHLLEGNTNKAKAYRAFRSEVLQTIEATLPDKDDPQGAERRKQLTKIRAEQVLDPIGQLVGVEPDKPDPSAVS